MTREMGEFTFTSGPHKGKTLSSWRRANADDAVKAIQSYADLMIGGMGRHTDKDGNELRHTYSWTFKDGKFIRADYVQDPNPGTGLIGIDPFTGQPTYWTFYANGARSESRFRQIADDEWWFDFIIQEAGRFKEVGQGTGKRQAPDKILNTGLLRSSDGTVQQLNDVWIRK